MHASNDQASATGATGGRSARILLVEDNPADVRLAREMLRESNVRTGLLGACTAEEPETIFDLTDEEGEKRPDLGPFGPGSPSEKWARPLEGDEDPLGAAPNPGRGIE